MATPVVYNGVSYSIPAFGDVGYAQGPGNLSSYLIALAGGPQASGGLFSLTAPLNFGPNFGLIAVNYTSTSANPATAGTIRLANTDTIDWRNFANSGNLPLGVNVSDQLTFNGVVISTAAAGGTVNAGIVGRLTLYPASGNTVDDVYTQNAFGINILIAAQAARSIALQYTIPNPGNAVAAATFALLELAQTFTAAQTFGALLTVNAAALITGTLTLSATTNQLILGTTNTVTITSPAPAASRVYTIPDVLGAASFVMTAGNQTIGGVKTFNGGAGAITLSASTIAMGNNVISGLAPAVATTDAVNLSQIYYGFQSPIQVTNTTSTASVGTAYTLTNLAATITPISTLHRIKISVTGDFQNNAQNVNNTFVSIFRGSTDLSNGAGFNSQGGGAAVSVVVPCGMTYIDSPATASATTYSVRIKSSAAASSLWNALNGTCVIILEEIV